MLVLNLKVLVFVKVTELFCSNATWLQIDMKSRQ